MFVHSKAKQLIAIIIILILISTSFSVSTYARNTNNNTNIEEETKITDIPNQEYFESSTNNEKIFLDTFTPTNSSNRSTSSINSGVYAISSQNTTSYARCNTINGGTYMSVQTFSSPPASEANRHAMFKIIYRSTTDDYVIRTMTNSEIIIYANVGYNAPLSIKLQNISDSSVSSDKTWKIAETTDGFYNISCTLSGTTYYLFMPTSGNLQLTTNPSLSGAKWNFHAYNGTMFRGWGQIGEWPDHIENGTSATIQAYIYSTVIGENTAYLLNQTDSDIATHYWTSSYPSQLILIPNYGGNTKVRIESNTRSTVFGYHNLMSGWDNGCFFIQNQYSSQEYLTITSTTSGTDVTLTGLPNGNNKEYTLWKLDYWSDGYYWINQDITGETLDGSNSLLNNTTMQPFAGDVIIQNLWKFVPQSDGTIKIQSYYHALNNPNYYMSLDDTSSKNIKFLSNAGEKQSWHIKPLQFNIEILFDRAFVDKYSSVGYLSVLNHVFGDNSIGYSIADSLFDNLGIRIDVKYISTLSNTFSSYPYSQSCLLSSSSNRDVLCVNHYNNVTSYSCNTTNQSTELSDCGDGINGSNKFHHKYWKYFDDNLSASTSYIPVLFTGHVGCGVNDSIHGTARVSGFANYTGGTSITILSQGGVSNTGDESARLLLHEIIHILNVPEDVFDYTNPELTNVYDPEKAYRMNCVMGYNRRQSPYIENLTICSNCINIINLYKYTFYCH